MPQWKIDGTTPMSEWKFVMDPKALSEGRRRGETQWKGLGERSCDYDYKRLMAERRGLNRRLSEHGESELREEEAIGARVSE